MASPQPKDLAAPAATRIPDADIDHAFLRRWSSRSFASEPLAPEQIRSLFEAARWAPSASNLQPWLFVYADDEETLSLARPIVRDGNRRWADRAPLLVFVFARRANPNTGDPNRLAAFDTGAAWMSLALQAERLGLVTHAMGGIHHDRAYEVLGVPRDDYESLCAVAVGKRDSPELLPDDLRSRETPSVRRPVGEIALRGSFNRV
jgi:nitroreductase